MTHSVEDKTRDAAASVDTAYTISVGEGFEGVLADKSDEDWIKVDLVAGESYDIRLSGIGPEAVPDTVLTIYDSDGEEVASNDDIESEAYNLFSMLEFSPEHSGAYYLSAGGYQSQYRDNVGTYEITVFDEQDDNLDTSLTLSVGGRFHGTLDTKFDQDWIKVDLVAGITYDITLKGIGPDADTDTVLRIYNQEGEQVGFHDDVDYAAGRTDSRLMFSPEATAAYYLGVGAFTGNPIQDNSGRYQVAVYDVDAGPLSLVGTEGNDYHHTRLIGGPGNDDLDGGAGWDWLEGGPGADTLIGSARWDIASYQHSGAGVEVRLDDGTARGGDAEGDMFATMKNFRYVPVGAGQSDSTVPDVEKAITARFLGREDDEEAAEDIEILDISDLFGSAHDDVLVGNHDENWLWGYYGDDTLDGKEGNDRLYGGDGADVLIGGDDNDTASYYSSTEGVEVNLHDGVARGGYAEGDSFAGRQTIEYKNPAGAVVEIEIPDIENLNGSLHNDILVGSHGSNRLTGFEGDDELDGRGGHDLLEGRDGADVLRGGAGNDLASYAYSDEAVEVRLHSGIARGGGAEGDTFPGTKTVEFVTSEGDTMEIEVPDIEDLIGSVYDDILVGAHGPNRLGGYRGDDELDGREGDDWLDGGPGADRLRGGEGNDTASYMFTSVFSSEGVVVRLHDGTARGGEAEGDIFAGTDVVEYTDAEGNTLMVEVPDIENLQGSSLADILAGDLRDNVISGDAGNDALYGGPRGGDDLLSGGPGDDRLYGGIGNDVLQGGPGNDQLRGGPDDDMLDGGEGDDVFFIAADGGNDTILDFGSGEDKLDLAAFVDIQSVEDLDIQQQETGAVIDLSAWGGGTVTLQDFNMADVMDACFVFYMDEGAAMA